MLKRDYLTARVVTKVIKRKIVQAGVASDMIGIVFDTTPTNVGEHTGAENYEARGCKKARLDR